MADEAAKQQEQAAGPRLALQKVYLKDASFESPRGHESFAGEWAPEIKLDMNLSRKTLSDNHAEITLNLTITAENKGEVAFLCEVHQAGIFLIEGMSDEQRNHVLNTACAGMVFPYARETIDNFVVKGGFPALMLAPINFDAVYQQAMQQQQQQAQERTGSETLN